jgi:hypothetical protein
VQSVMGLIGFSLGPLATGVAIDSVAAALFGDRAPQGFLAACPGGRAAEGAPAALDAACRLAVVDATQIVIIAFIALLVWPAWHFFLAGRHMKRRDKSNPSIV